MRALTLDSVPSAPAVTEVEAPRPEAGELLVSVAASSVNGFDAATAAGFFLGRREHRFPLVLGKDFVGTVEELGAGVVDFEPGDAVFGVVMKPFLGTGSLAEYVTVPADYGVAHLPAGLAATDAAALGLAGTAAWDGVTALAVRPGETVLISGASGGVGAFAVQYAAARGAKLLVTALPGPESDFVRQLAGTEMHVLDYSGGTDDVAVQARRAAPQCVDAVLHLAGDGALLASLLRAGGRFVSTIGFGPESVGDPSVTAHAVMARPNRATLERLAADVIAGTIRVPVTAAYPLERAPEAFEAFTAGAMGKIVITMV
ncbi:MAG TPA: NADP-dependent oxidoreductase [Streptomyces sp.]|nr:NADP-dependent oxidoreductase [Streptomyces sp.]